MPSRTRACVNRHAPGRPGDGLASPRCSAAARARSTSPLSGPTAATRAGSKASPSTLAAASTAHASSSRPRSRDRTSPLTSALPPTMRASVCSSSGPPGSVTSSRARVVTYSGLPRAWARTTRASSGVTVTPAARRIPASAASSSAPSRSMCSPGSRARSPSAARAGPSVASRLVASTSSRDSGSSAASSRSRNSEAWSAQCRSSSTTSRPSWSAAAVIASAAAAAARYRAAVRSSERAPSAAASPVSWPQASSPPTAPRIRRHIHSGGAPWSSTPRPHSTRCPSRRAWPASSSASRVLPIPGGPVTRARAPWPARAADRLPRSSASSCSRPASSPRPGASPATPRLSPGRPNPVHRKSTWRARY